MWGGEVWCCEGEVRYSGEPRVKEGKWKRGEAKQLWGRLSLGNATAVVWCGVDHLLIGRLPRTPI